MANFDQSEKVSKIDSVEAMGTTWEVTGGYSPSPWSRILSDSTDHAWLGLGPAEISDTQLVSPELEVSDSAPFVISFSYRHDFEVELDTVYYDAGVIEISANGGPWTDVSTYATVGYGGVVQSASNNPLGGRSAYVARNPSWPGEDSVTLELGSALAGQTARVRFRVGTDEALQLGGWQIDDIAFSGIDNAPFTSVSPRTALVCRTAELVERRARAVHPTEERRTAAAPRQGARAKAANLRGMVGVPARAEARRATPARVTSRSPRPRAKTTAAAAAAPALIRARPSPGYPRSRSGSPFRGDGCVRVEARNIVTLHCER
jgi:hypothetical protein